MLSRAPLLSSLFLAMPVCETHRPSWMHAHPTDSVTPVLNFSYPSVFLHLENLPDWPAVVAGPREGLVVCNRSSVNTEKAVAARRRRITPSAEGWSDRTLLGSNRLHFTACTGWKDSSWTGTFMSVRKFNHSCSLRAGKRSAYGKDQFQVTEVCPGARCQLFTTYWNGLVAGRRQEGRDEHSKTNRRRSQRA